MPFLLRREGIPVETIAGISALTVLPFTLMVAWSPLADMLLSRRNWVLVANFVSATLLFVAILLPRPKYLALFTALLFGGNVVATLGAIALGGLMAVSVPDGARGKSAAWYTAGNAGSYPLLGGAALWVIERMTLTHAAAAIALMAFVPSLAVLFVEEPRRSLARAGRCFARCSTRSRYCFRSAGPGSAFSSFSLRWERAPRPASFPESAWTTKRRRGQCSG
jgi:MFS family permease